MTLHTNLFWLWGAVAVAAGVLAGEAWVMPGAAPTPAAFTALLTPIGGEFNLVDEDVGRGPRQASRRVLRLHALPRHLRDTLAELSALLADLGDRSDGLQVLLVTLSATHPRF